MFKRHTGKIRAATATAAVAVVLVSGYGYGELRASQARTTEAARPDAVKEAQADYIREVNARDVCAARYTAMERLQGKPAVEACHKVEEIRAKAARLEPVG